MNKDKELNILAFDPGSKTTGVAMAYNVTLNNGFSDSFPVHRAVVKHKDRFGDKGLEYWLLSEDWDVVICESFTLYKDKAVAQTNAKFEVVENIGIIKYICDKHNINLVMQTPAQMKAKKYKKLKYTSNSSKSIHSLDALRHIQCYQLTHKYKNRTMVKF